MEDTARLAVVEQSVRDEHKFHGILFELLRQFGHILEYPHDQQVRIIDRQFLSDGFKHDAFRDYLIYVGFQLEDSKFVYPKELPLNRLRVAKEAIEKKINFCYGAKITRKNSKCNQFMAPQLTPTNILTTKNPFLLKIQDLFNQVLEYEDEELMALAREQVPHVALQINAMERVREQQKQIKSGEIKDQDLAFDLAFIMELLAWFKHEFFTWVDKPPCDSCNGPTTLIKTVVATVEGERCRVEEYRCGSCGGGASFPRHARARSLLRTRRGRCGEWANCFALLCSAFGYETRYVYDVTDHVWCEIYDFDSKSWLHVDPCEAKLNTPLMYEHGWGKKLSYVIAVSRDDVQDVTWRYTLNHKEVLSRRTLCSEHELLRALLLLRAERQAAVSAARRAHLERRTLAELVHLMQERKPSDYESQGRISGSIQWRSARGEVGQGYTFEFSHAGPCSVRYCTATDKYSVSEAGEDTRSVESWVAGTYHNENIFRMIEHDWKMVYLARNVGEDEGTVSWRFAASGDLRLTEMRLIITTAVYETGTITWTVQYDQEEPQPLNVNGGVASLEAGGAGRVSVVLRARLAGGAGEVRWQHAQLARSALATHDCTLEFQANVI